MRTSLLFARNLPHRLARAQSNPFVRQAPVVPRGASVSVLAGCRGPARPANPPQVPQYYPHFRARRPANAAVTMYLQSSNGAKQPLDPRSPQALQLAAEVQHRQTIGPSTPPVGSCTGKFCLPMPLPNDPGAQACAEFTSELCGD